MCEPSEDDPTRRCPEISLAENLLGWRPEIDLDTGLRRTIAALRETFREPVT